MREVEKLGEDLPETGCLFSKSIHSSGLERWGGSKEPWLLSDFLSSVPRSHSQLQGADAVFWPSPESTYTHLKLCALRPSAPAWLCLKIITV